jgi:hypothetical protein
VFHTKHDFTPELGWAAFQLIGGLGRVDVSRGDLEQAARAATSPRARRSDTAKILGALQELDLIERDGKQVTLSECGRALLSGVGSFEAGFRAAVHCVYAWKWLWDGEPDLASPSWSYRAVCRAILGSPVSGVTADDLVLQVLSGAERFATDKVSFSRSSVSGVTGWLKAQSPPLISAHEQRISRVPGQAPSATALRLHLAALSAINESRVLLDPDNVSLLSEALLLPADELWLPVVEFARESAEFAFIPGGRGTVVFQHSDDTFVAWVVRRAAGDGLARRLRTHTREERA